MGQCFMGRCKRVIALMTAVLLVLAGCGRNAAFRDYGNHFGQGTAFENTSDLKDVTLNLFFQAAQHKNSREVLDEVEKKLSQSLKTKLVFKYISDNPQNYMNNLRKIIDSGEDCDAFTYNEGIPGRLKGLVIDKVAADLTAVFPKYAPALYKKLSKDELRSATVDGKLVTVPARLPRTDRRYAFVRDDFMKKYGIKDIKGYDDFEEYMQKVVENETGVFPTIYNDTSIGLFAEASGYYILDYRAGLVYKSSDPDMKLMAWEQTPEFKKSIERMYRWNKKGYLATNSGRAQIDESVVASGKWASVIAPVSQGMEFNSLLKSRANVNWRYNPYPLCPGKPSARTSPVNNALVVSSKSPNAERVMMFVNWLQSNQDNYDLLMYGVKGKHFTLTGDQIKLPAGVLKKDAYLNWGGRGVFRNIDYERGDIGESAELKKWYLKEFEENTKYPPHMGFTPDYTPLSNMMNIRTLSFGRIESNLSNNSFNMNNIDEYIKEKKNEGADHMVMEIQKQLDRWNVK